MQEQFLAFDVGGTTIKYALVDKQQTITNRGSVSTDHNRDGAILTQLTRITQQTLSQQPLAGIGVSTAGIVGEDGEIKYAGPTIPNYQGTPIKAHLQSASHLPVDVVNDVDAALLGETVAGQAVHATSVYCVALGTGIGGAFAINGQLYSGAHGNANSIGYTSYHESDQTTYEQRAATLSLQSMVEPYGISVIEAFEQARNNQQPALTIIQNWCDNVAAGLANVLLILDPEVLILGGAVAKQSDFLVSLLTQSLSKFVPDGLLNTVVRASALSNDAQIYGAIAHFLK